jgi:hypothetical protein
MFAGDYENDPAFRQRFQDWIAQLWAAKDRRIGELKKGELKKGTQPFFGAA